MAEPKFESLRAGYRQLWDKSAVTKVAEAGREAQLINKQRPTYEDVGKAVGAPWWAGAVLHLREAGGSGVGRLPWGFSQCGKIIWARQKNPNLAVGAGPISQPFKA